MPPAANPVAGNADNVSNVAGAATKLSTADSTKPRMRICGCTLKRETWQWLLAGVLIPLGALAVSVGAIVQAAKSSQSGNPPPRASQSASWLSERGIDTSPSTTSVMPARAPSGTDEPTIAARSGGSSDSTLVGDAEAAPTPSSQRQRRPVHQLGAACNGNEEVCDDIELLCTRFIPTGAACAASASTSRCCVPPIGTAEGCGGADRDDVYAVFDDICEWIDLQCSSGAFVCDVAYAPVRPGMVRGQPQTPGAVSPAAPTPAGVRELPAGLVGRGPAPAAWPGAAALAVAPGPSRAAGPPSAAAGLPPGSGAAAGTGDRSDKGAEGTTSRFFIISMVVGGGLMLLGVLMCAGLAMKKRRKRASSVVDLEA